MIATLPQETIEQELLWRKARSFKNDPLGFVRWAFPWGEPGPLANETGPDEVQDEFLISLGNEVRARAFDGQTPVLPSVCASPAVTARENR